jgi:hypothetical protein
VLDLQGNGIGDAGVRALVDSPGGANLTRLDLPANLVGPDGALVNSPHLTRLVELNVWGCPVRRGTKAGKALRARFGKGLLCG